MEWITTAVLQWWTFRSWILGALLLTASVYLRGWRQLHRRFPQRFEVWRLGVFQAGLFAIFLGLGSPLHALAQQLLQFHMIQHLLLTMVVPPLLWLGAPALPLLYGLPRAILPYALKPLRRLCRFVPSPVVCLIAFASSNVAWHIPDLYEFALRSEFWHAVQPIGFLSTALLFWWPVVQPWPSRLGWPHWAMILYLLFADIQNAVLSAFLIFSGRVLYPTYANVPRVWNSSALEDQAAAGAIMLVPASIIFLIAVAVLAIRWLEPSARMGLRLEVERSS